jgi:hypothetical protein
LDNNDSTITHVITDRETILKEKTKEYVQPQWIYDSVNFNKLLNVKEYQVNKVIICLFSHYLLMFLPSLMKMILIGTSH